VAGVEWKCDRLWRTSGQCAAFSALSGDGGLYRRVTAGSGTRRSRPNGSAFDPARPIKIGVRDGRSGRTREVQEQRAFEPFFTTWRMQGVGARLRGRRRSWRVRAPVVGAGRPRWHHRDLYFPVGQGQPELECARQRRSEGASCASRRKPLCLESSPARARGGDISWS